MKIYKFGGASVNSAEGANRLARIVGNNTDNLVVVISAMGKTTNMLEAVVDSYFNRKPDLTDNVRKVKDFHLDIVKNLYKDKGNISGLLDNIFGQLDKTVSQKPSLSYDFEYDRIVCFGEILSTSIVSDYLNSSGIKNTFVDIRNYIKSDDNYREGIVEPDYYTRTRGLRLFGSTARLDAQCRERNDMERRTRCDECRPEIVR